MLFTVLTFIGQIVFFIIITNLDISLAAQTIAVAVQCDCICNYHIWFNSCNNSLCGH